ncbi:MAG: hypothetical protein M5U28_13970 [Sandaracinaceae bacterium]|nr:hypothetical protein [Sandaracinaceae bacterium]
MKLLFVLESQFSKLPEGDVNKFLVTTLPKLTNELLSFIGCLRHGSAWGSLHHTRAIIEIAAMVNHINASPAKRERRLAKYAEFTDFVRCQFFLGLTPDSDGSISEAAAARGLPPPTTAEVSLWWKRIETWRSLYVTAKRPDLSQVRYWHAPASLEQLVRDLGSDDAWWSNYERLCHGTHVSPLGYRLVVQGNPMLVGFRGDQPHVLLALQGLTMAFARCIVEFDKLLEEKLIGALEPEASALLLAARAERERLKS